jgi:aspartate kinase
LVRTDCQGIDARYINLDCVVPKVLKHSELDQTFYNKLAIAIAEEVLQSGGQVPVVTGYFGIVPGSLLSAIGRGYTDLCAALLAVGLGAEELQIWKEVDGIFTADPRKVPTARLLSSITPDEAAELTFFGSEVIQI